MRFVGAALKGLKVGIKQVEEGHNQVYFDTILPGDLYDIDYTGLQTMIGVHQVDEKKRGKG